MKDLYSAASNPTDESVAEYKNRAGELIEEYQSMADDIEVVQLDEKVVGKGIWGSFSDLETPGNGYLACGVKVRSEKWQGDDYDDTALNGIRFKYCSVSRPDSQWGEWLSKGHWGEYIEASCEPGYFISKIDIKIERN